MEYMARSDMRDDAKHRPLHVLYPHALQKKGTVFFRRTEYFLDVLQFYSSSSTGQWSLPCTSIKISAFLICGANRSDTRK